MLSRVADALFWMSRYLERAEHISRLLDVGFHLELDLHGVHADTRAQDTEAMCTILQLPRHEMDNGALQHWLTFDLDNPNSIMACVNRARNNARSVRGAIAPAMWRELNILRRPVRRAAVRRARARRDRSVRPVTEGSRPFESGRQQSNGADGPMSKFLRESIRDFAVISLQWLLTFYFRPWPE